MGVKILSDEQLGKFHFQEGLFFFTKKNSQEDTYTDSPLRVLTFTLVLLFA